jgi:hypothetical protein
VLPPSSLEYIHHSIDWVEVKYKNRNYFSLMGPLSFRCAGHPIFEWRSVRIPEAVRAKDLSDMKNTLESASFPTSQRAAVAPSRWLKLGVVAAASAFAGGLAAAWWYRKTLTKLRDAEQDHSDSHFEISEDNPADDL